MSDPVLSCSHNMSADGIFGGDICQLGQQPDYIELTCSHKYRGIIAPTLMFRQNCLKFGVNRTKTNVSHTEKHSVVTSTTVVQASERMNGSYFTCSTHMKWNKSSISNEYLNLNISWTSPVIDLLCMYYIHSTSYYSTYFMRCQCCTKGYARLPRHRAQLY